MEDYQIDSEKECPRCRSKKIAIQVYQGWTFQSHSPMCAGCGLGRNETRIATSQTVAKAALINYYYDYERLQNRNHS